MEGIVINDDMDLIAAVLTTGRMMELKVRAGGLDFINDNFLTIRKILFFYIMFHMMLPSLLFGLILDNLGFSASSNNNFW